MRFVLELGKSLDQARLDLIEKIRKLDEEKLNIENLIKQEELKLKTCSEEARKNAELIGQSENTSLYFVKFFFFFFYNFNSKTKNNYLKVMANNIDALKEKLDYYREQLNFEIKLFKGKFCLSHEIFSQVSRK